MKLKIQTDRKYLNGGDDIPPVVMYDGELSFNPAVGQDITVWSGWCSEVVKEVSPCIESGEILVVLNCPPSIGYYNEAKKREITQYKRSHEWWQNTD